MPDSDTKSGCAGTATFTGVVRITIPSTVEGQPEQVEIVIDGAEPLYAEIRIPNAFRGPDGEIVKLEPGDRVTLFVESNQTRESPQGNRLRVRWRSPTIAVLWQ